MGLGWRLPASTVVVAASIAGCGRVAFDDRSDARAGVAATDRFELAPPAFSTPGPTFTAVPGSRVELGARPVGRPWIVWLSATVGSTLDPEMSAEVRYTVDGVERGYGGVQNRVADRRGSFHHFVAVDTSAGASVLEVDLRDVAGGVATIEQLRIVGFVAPAGADVHYTEMNPPVPITTTAHAEYHRLSLTPAAPGTYVVFGAVAGSEFPSTAADVEVRWVEDVAGTAFPPAERYLNVRQPWQTFAMVRLVDLPDTTPRSVRLEALAGAAGGLRASHLLALRADAFGDVIGRLDEAEITVASAETAVMSQLVVPATQSAAYVVLQSMRLSDPCPGTSTREARFEIDAGIATAIDHAIDNCAYQPGYGSVSLVEQDDSLVVRNVVAPTMGQVVMAAVSYIYVLQLSPAP